MWAGRFLASILALVMVSSLFLGFPLNVGANTDSADAFGYRWTDSYSPDPTVGFSWIEIVGTGTNTGVYYDDDWDGPFPIGFPFSFYGNAYSDFYVTTNGYVTFGSGDYDYTNEPIPSTTTPNNFIAAYWYDLYVESGGGIYYETIGSAPNRQLIVEWLHTRQLDTSNLMSFEIILNETGEIWTQYNLLHYDRGWHCTVGIENSDGSIGCQYSYDEAVLWDGLAIMYSIAPVSIGPDDQQMGPPGTDVYYWLVVGNHQDITDSLDLTSSSLENWSIRFCDSMLDPLVDNNGNGIPDTGDVAPASSVTICALVTVPDTPVVLFEQTTIVATSFVNPALWDDTLLITQAQGAAIAPPHTDQGDDVDSDGLYDYLVVDVNIDVFLPGYYCLEASLYDQFGVWIDHCSVGGGFDPGSGMLQAVFAAHLIRSNGVNGPFVVALSLYDGFGSYLGDDTHVTHFYAADDFEIPIEFAPPHTDYGVDTGGDGLYNYLVVEVSVNVHHSGNFTIDTRLLNSTWGLIWWASNFTYLEVGANVVELTYPGIFIHDYGADGPYIVLISLYFGSALIATDQHTTAGYLWSDFNGPLAVFAPPHSDYGIDQTGEGKYEYLVVEVSLDVAEAETVELLGILYGPLGSSFSAGNLTYVDVGLQTLELSFPGWWIRENDVNGNFSVYLELRDVNGYYYSLSDWYLTAYYEYDDFHARVEFIPPHADYGLDIDGDGLFNYLVIELQVYVMVEDSYVFFLDLYNASGWFIWGNGYYMHLEVGMNTITWFVPGWYILNNSMDGPYDAYIDVYRSWLYNWVNNCTYTTAPYLYTDFNGPPATFAPPHDDFGYDEDGDSLFDYLVVEVVVDVDIAGEYGVRAVLYDSISNELGSEINNTYLDTGLQTIQFRFLAWQINTNGVDGPYYVDLHMYDSDGNDVAYGNHTTQPYAWSDFEPYPAVFSPPHSDYGLDLDGDGLYDYLVVEVYVDVASPGMFFVYGDLPAPVWLEVHNETYLDVGIQVVELWFQGYVIGNTNESGNFTVYLGIYVYLDDYTFLLDWEMYITTWYGWYEFEPPPVAFDHPHSDYGLDTDSDGLYEYLVLQVSVNASVAGTYWIMAWVHLDTSAGFGSNLTYLDIGLHVVEIKVPGWQMVTHALNGPYSVELRAWGEEFSYILDEDWYLTDAYVYDDFEGAIPTIFSSWAATPPTIDGILSADEWAGAATVDMSAVDQLNLVDATMLVMNNGTHLFVAYDATGDITEGLDDRSSIAFDTGNDEIITDGGDDQFVLSEDIRGGPVHYVWDNSSGYIIDCQPFDEMLPDHAGLKGALGFGPSDMSALGHRMYEYAIPLALIDAAAGDVLGFMGCSFFMPGVLDLDTYHSASWPVIAYYWASLQDFGDLVLASLPTTTVTLEGTAGLDGWFISDVTVSMTTTGGQGGVDYTMYRVDEGAWTTYAAPFVIVGDGVHTLEFYSVDMAGNSEPVQSVDVMIDLNSPITTAAFVGTGSGEWWSIDVEVTLTADDGAGSGADVTYYSIDGGLWQSYSAPFTVMDEGIHTVEFYSIDLAGNEEEVVSIAIKIESVAPTTTHALAGTQGPDGWFTTAVTVTLTATDGVGGSGIADTMYRIGTGSWQTYTAPLSMFAEDYFNVSYYSVDNAGNIEATKYVEFGIDTTDPTTTHSVAGTAGQNGWYLSAVTVTLAAADGAGGSGPDEIKYRIGTGGWQTYSSAISVSTDGTTTIEYYALDNAGNQEAAKSVVVRIDREAPSTTASVEDGTVTLTAADTTSGIARIECRIDDGTWQTYSGAIEVTGKGNHTVEFRAVDNAGNTETAQTTYVEIGGGGALSGAALFGIIAAVVIIAAVAVVLLLMRRKKSPGASEEPSPPTEPPSH